MAFVPTWVKVYSLRVILITQNGIVNRKKHKVGNKSAGAVLDRLQSVFSVDSDNALSDVLGIKRSTLGNWRSRESVPYTLCVDLAEQRGLSLDWLLAGNGPMTRGGEWSVPEVIPSESELLAIVRALDESGRQAVRVLAEERMTAQLVRQQMHALSEVLRIWTEAEGKSVTETSGPLMDSIRNYLTLEAQVAAKTAK